MLDLAPLRQPLTTPGTPGLDTLDQRFQDIAALAEADQHVQAAQQTASLFAEDIYDIRLLAYFWYGVFEESGLPALGDIVDSIIGIFRESWAAVGPPKKKEAQTQNALLAFFAKLQRKVEFEEQTKGEAWGQWTSTMTPEGMDALLEKLGELRKAIGQTIGDAPKAVDQLSKLVEWLKSFSSIVATGAAPPSAPEAAPPPSAAEEVPSTRGPDAAPAGGTTVDVQLPLVEGSLKLRDLIAKLEAFQALCQKEDLAKAALVADDVIASLNAFDPRQYFPKLFMPFYQTLAPKVEQISQFWANKESLPWQSMEQLYKMSLEAFVEL